MSFHDESAAGACPQAHRKFMPSIVVTLTTRVIWLSSFIKLTPHDPAHLLIFMSVSIVSAVKLYDSRWTGQFSQRSGCVSFHRKQLVALALLDD